MFKGWADLRVSDGKGSRTKVKQRLKMVKSEEEKAGVRGEQYARQTMSGEQLPHCGLPVPAQPFYSTLLHVSAASI